MVIFYMESGFAKNNVEFLIKKFAVGGTPQL